MRLNPRIGSVAVVLVVVLIASGVAGAPSASEYTNTDDNEEASHERRVFVCMTGQTQRAELEQKIDNLFRPLQNHSSEVVIGLVLETPRQPQFVYSNFECTKGEFASPKDLKNELSHRGFNASAVDRIERAPDSAKNSEAFRVMMNRLVNLRNEERHIAYLRMKMHLSQWEKLWTCNTLMEQEERERGKNFSHVFRLREDGVLPYPADAETLLSAPENSAKNTVGTCMCESFGGMNDQWQLSPRASAERMLKAPLEVITKDQHTLLASEERMNPETLMYLSLRSSGLKIHTFKPTTMTLLRERCGCVKCIPTLLPCLRKNGFNKRMYSDVRSRCCAH